MNSNYSIDYDLNLMTFIILIMRLYLNLVKLLILKV